MFKTWQIFLFALVPLGLVFAGVFIGSIHGSDSERDRELFPTPAPAATPRALAAPGLDDTRGATLDMTADRLLSQSTTSMSLSAVGLAAMSDQDASASRSTALQRTKLVPGRARPS